MAMTVSQASAVLDDLIARANQDGDPITITSEHGDVVLISKTEFSALEETAHLSHLPADARRLSEGLARARRASSSAG